MKYFHSLFVMFTLLAALTACGPGKDRVRIKGKLANITTAEFYVFSEDGSFDGVDTIRIEDGQFTYERKLTEPAILTLLYPNFTQTYLVAEPGKTIKMKGDAAKIGDAEITGTDENKMLTEFREEIAGKPRIRTNWRLNSSFARTANRWRLWRCSGVTLR